MRPVLLLLTCIFAFLYSLRGHAYVPPSSPDDETKKIILEEIKKTNDRKGINVKYRIGGKSVVKFINSTKVGRFLKFAGKRVIPAFTFLDFAQDFADKRASMLLDNEGNLVVTPNYTDDRSVLALSVNGKYQTGHSCSLMFAELKRRYEGDQLNDLSRARLYGCKAGSRNRYWVEFYYPDEQIPGRDIRTKQIAIGLEQVSVDKLTDVKSYAVHPQLQPQTGVGQVIARRATDYDLGEAALEKMTEEELAPLFDYGVDYQSPPAVEALREANVPEPYPDITSPKLDELPDYVGSDPDVSTDVDVSESEPGTQPEPGQLPRFCEWTPVVCDAAEVVKRIPSQLQTIFSDKPDQDTELDFDDDRESADDTNIAFSGTCPADVNFNFNLFGKDIEWVLMPWAKFCGILSTYVNPALKILGAFFAILILGGRANG